MERLQRTLDIRWNGITNTIKVASVIDMLRKLGKHSEPDGLTLDMERRNGSFGFHIQGYESEAILQGNGQALFVGETVNALKSVQLLFNKTPLLTLSDYSDISISKEENHRVATQLTVNVGSIQIAPGIVLPETHFTASAANLESKAFHKLSPFFNDASLMMLALCPKEFSREPVFTRAEQQRILTPVLALLSGQIRLSLSPLSIKDESGEIRIEINASLIKPASMSADLSLEEIGKLLPQAIDSVDARLSLSKAAMTNFIEKSLKSMGPYTMAEPELLRSEAEKNVKEFSARMVAKGLARSEGDTLTSQLKFSSGRLHINDLVVRLTEFPDVLLPDAEETSEGAPNIDHDVTDDTSRGETRL